MPDLLKKSSRRVVEPYDRVSELLFGLIMVLTFTGSLSVATANQAEIRTMLLGALGCNLAWGIIDGVFYLMGCLADRGKELLTLRAVQRAGDSNKAQRLIADALPPLLAPVVKPEELEAFRERLAAQPEPPTQARLTGEDWQGALAVFGWVFLSTFPVVLPFLFMQNATPALRVSNLIAIAMLFGAGWALGRITSRTPWVTGVGMVCLGVVLVGLTMALGG